jgi:hypothetical protein
MGGGLGRWGRRGGVRGGNSEQEGSVYLAREREETPIMIARQPK